MQIKLSIKLFGAFFLILAIVVGAMALSRYLFKVDFKNYIHQVELEKLERLVPFLQAEYRADRSWEGLRADSQRWRSLTRPVPDFEGDAALPPPSAFPPGRPPRVLLMDARQRPIIGRSGPDEKLQQVPIRVDGEIVGWLGLHTHEPFKSGPPAILLQRQARQFYGIGAVVVGLTALIAFLFSRHLLKPIQRLTRGTRELADRNFKVRIAATTRDELGRLADNFNAMARTLDNYEQMRRQWLTDISHELRTPLAVLRGEVEALQDGVRDPTPRNLASLHAEILRISKLVDDLHLLSMSDSDRLDLSLEWMSPCRILDRIADGYQTRFARRSIQLDLMVDAIKDRRIQGDALRLGQVFTNIIENACKYVQSPGALKISGQSDDHHLTLYFEDSGPGVPGEALPRLFDRLYRVDASRNRDSGGSGLGLSICRQIVDCHGGDIWAQNSTMGGLSIVVRLPLT